MIEEDKDLELLNAKKMLELRKRLSATSSPKKGDEEGKKVKTPREILLEHLVDRGDEVLSVAESAYPKETPIIVRRLSDLISRGQVDKITGGELLQLFRSLGMRVSVRTTISVAERGKVVSLADKLKQGGR